MVGFELVATNSSSVAAVHDPVPFSFEHIAVVFVHVNITSSGV